MSWFVTEANSWLSKPEVANAFGLILYTDRHAHTKKVLNDPDFWRSLDDRTGKRWPVFVLKGKPGNFEMPKVRRGSLSLMVPVWKEPKENEAILEELSLNGTQNPHLLVYSILPNGDLLYHTMELSEESSDAAYKALKETLDAATTAIDDVLPENLKSAEGLNAALDLTITSLKQWRLIKKGASLGGIVQRVFKALHGG